MEEGRIDQGFKVLIIGGSAGSLDVLMRVLPELPAFRSYAMVIVLHRKSAEDNNLEELIAFKARVPVAEVEDKVPFLPGSIYVAPSDYHLLFEKDQTLSLDNSEKVHYSRPSIDVSFESVAEVYGPLVTAVLLSGANADGTEGLMAVKAAGGKVIIQDPASALVPFMPAKALEKTNPDEVMSPGDLADYISLVYAAE